MKFEEQESIEDSSKDEIVETEEVESASSEKTKPMLDYNNIKSSQDIDVPPLLIDQVIGHEESMETIKKAAKQRRNVLRGCRETSVFLSKETGISGIFAGRIKGAKCPFDLQFLTWDFS